MSGNILEICKQFVDEANDKFPGSWVIEELDKKGEIPVLVVGKGHIYVNPVTGELQTKLAMPAVDKLRARLGLLVPVVPGKGGQVGLVAPPEARSTAARELKNILDQRATSFGVGSGKKAPSAAMIGRAANASGLNFRVINHTHRPDYVEVHVRCYRGKQINETVISMYKDEYLAPYAWELVENHCKSEVTGANPSNGYPVLKKGAKVRVSKRIGDSNIMEEVDAGLWLFQKLAAKWLFCGRTLETKAKARAAEQLMNTDATPRAFQEAQELEDEAFEMELVESMKADNPAYGLG